MSSSDNLSKQLGQRSHPTKPWAWSGSNCLALRWYSFKTFFEKVDSEKISRRLKKTWKFPRGQRINPAAQKMAQTWQSLGLFLGQRAGRPPDKNALAENYFSHFSTKTYVVGTQKNPLNVTVLLSTLNICLKWWGRNNYNFTLKNYA